MQRKEVKVTAKQKLSPPPIGPSKHSSKKLALKTSPRPTARKKPFKLKKSEQHEASKSRVRILKGRKKGRIEVVSDDSSRKTPTLNYLPSHKLPKLEAELYERAIAKLLSSGWKLEPAAQLILRRAIRGATLRLKSRGAPRNEVEKVRILLQVFGESFAIVPRGLITGAVMERKAKRWLPCPPFCKEGKENG